MALQKNQERKDPELSGKALKAFNNLSHGKESHHEIQRVLVEIYKIIKEVIGDKCINQNSNFPDRIEFLLDAKLNIFFYIDFSVSPSGGENTWDLEGNIIYGARNKSKFDYNVKNKCINCGGTILCKCVRTRPLLVLTVNEYGIIESKDKIEDNWSLELSENKINVSAGQNTKILTEVHYRILEYIFLEALSFINEKYKNI